MVKGEGVRLLGAAMMLGVFLMGVGCASTQPITRASCGQGNMALEIVVSECTEGDAFCNAACTGGVERLSLVSSGGNFDASDAKTKCDKPSGPCTNKKSKVCWNFDLASAVTKAEVTHVSSKGAEELYSDQSKTYGGGGKTDFTIKTNPAAGRGEWGYEIKLYQGRDGDQLYACVDPRIVVEPP